MKENPLKLTDEQIAAVLELGSTNPDHSRIREDILAELLQLEIVSPRSDGRVDFTGVGKKVYDVLVRQAA